MGQIMGAGGLGHLFAHILQGDGDHLAGERPVNRGKPIQSEIRDHPAQRGALHQEREEGKASGQNPDITLDLDRHAEVLRHRERQCQGHRPTQPAPEDRHPVGPIHLGGQAHHRQKRQDSIKHEQPRRGGRHHDHKDEEQVIKPHIPQETGHKEGGEQKDQRPGPMRQHIPKLSQVGPVGGRQTTWPQIVQRHPGHHHRHDARDAKNLIGHEIGDIGQGHAERDLRQCKAAEPGENRQADPPQHPANAQTPKDHRRKTHQGVLQRGVRHTQHDKSQEKPEQRDGGGVVEQAFALDQTGQALWGRDIAKDRDHGRRIGGGHDRAQQKAGDQRQFGERQECQADGKGRHHHRHHCHDKDRHPVIRHAPQVQPQGDLKQQGGQQHIQKYIGADRNFKAFGGGQRVGERIADRRVRGERGRANANQHADDRQHHRIGQPKPVGQRLA